MTHYHKASKILCVIIVIILNISVTNLLTHAAVEQLLIITDYFDFYSFAITDHSTGTVTNIYTINVQESNRYTHGNVRAFVNYTATANTDYTCIVNLDSIADMKLSKYKSCEVLINLWLYIPQNSNDDDTYYPSTRINYIRATLDNGLIKSSSATVDYIAGQSSYLRFNYVLPLTGQDIDKLQLAFNFTTNSLIDTVDQQLITFYGYIQIDNKTNPQLEDLESTIVGDPSATEPPVINDIENKNEQLNQYLDPFENDLNNVDLIDPLRNSQNKILSGYIYATRILETIINYEPVYIIIFFVLTLGIVTLFLRYKHR